MRFSEYGGDLVDRFDIDPLNTHLQGFYVRFFLGYHRRGYQGWDKIFHFDIQLTIRMEQYLASRVLHTCAADPDDMPAFCQPEREVAVGIRDGADGWIIEINRRADEGFAIAGVPDISYQRRVTLWLTSRNADLDEFIFQRGP